MARRSELLIALNCVVSKTHGFVMMQVAKLGFQYITFCRSSCKEEAEEETLAGKGFPLLGSYVLDLRPT